MRVEMSPDFDDICCNTPQAIDAVDKKARAIAARANAMGEPSKEWHDVGKHDKSKGDNGVWHDYSHVKAHPIIGGTPVNYLAKPPKKSRQGRMVSIVVTENYAAKKDNMKNNTLLKALG